MLPSWDEAYETGNAMIDDQHRQILQLTDDLERAEIDAADRQTIYSVLDQVMDFNMEEGLMVSIDYPPEDQMQMVHEHREFKSYARLRVLEFRSGDLTTVLPLKRFLVKWLLEHEFGHDMKLVAYMREKGSAS
jgi:two-component system NtrC family sensor kinase